MNLREPNSTFNTSFIIQTYIEVTTDDRSVVRLLYYILLFKLTDQCIHTPMHYMHRKIMKEISEINHISFRTHIYFFT